MTFPKESAHQQNHLISCPANGDLAVIADTCDHYNCIPSRKLLLLITQLIRHSRPMLLVWSGFTKYMRQQQTLGIQQIKPPKKHQRTKRST
mmetsp:Transcript_14148/g.41509  ORF Transcript_14148/g.41509 Transcript_14148/m.41509 type:complete len:91 (-) Transcript_14148:280-552(-)